MDELGMRLDRIASKLAAQGLSFAHQLDPAEVSRFERESTVQLTTDYRTFVLRFGEGTRGSRSPNGPGPGLGLLPLRDWDRLALISDLRRVVANPFPVDPGIEYTEEDWERRTGVDLMDDAQPWPPGAITISDYGGGMYDALVLTGPGRGRVVYLQHDHLPYFYPTFRDFIAWYEAWLDAAALGRDLWNID